MILSGGGIPARSAFIGAHGSAPEEVVLDLDATDDLIHGNQEGRFFHGYYGNCPPPAQNVSKTGPIGGLFPNISSPNVRGKVDDIVRKLGLVAMPPRR